MGVKVKWGEKRKRRTKRLDVLQQDAVWFRPESVSICSQPAPCMCRRTAAIWQRLVETEARGCSEGRPAPSRSSFCSKLVPVFLYILHLRSAVASLLSCDVTAREDKHLVLVLLAVSGGRGSIPAASVSFQIVFAI